MTRRYRWWTGEDQPHLHEWWLPLLAASRHAARTRFRGPSTSTNSQSSDGPTVGLVRPCGCTGMAASGHVLLTDADGETYRYIPRVSDPERGQFRSIDIRAAIWRAHLPDHVEPVWYEPPQRRQYAEPQVDASSSAILRLVHPAR